MKSMVYLLVVITSFDGGMTSQLIPQIHMQQCQVNKRNLDGKVLANGRYIQKAKATCVEGVK